MRHRSAALTDPSTLAPAGDDPHVIQVVIETPKGSRNKYAFNADLRIFSLKKVLPAGMAFPYDFGFVPSTAGGDGDPLDVLVLMDEPAFPGCLLTCRLLGVIRGRQREGKRWITNDRIIAVERNNHSFASVRHLNDLGTHFLKELEEFFVNYHELDDERFEIAGTAGPHHARDCVKRGVRAARKR
jgi:inorganic pyrophosphatase